MPLVKREIWKERDLLQTEVLIIDAEAEPQLRLLVVPGNPGQAGYYVPLLQSLYCGFGGRASVMAISHLGMSCDVQETHLGELKTFSLADQMQHKVEFIQHLLRLDSSPLVILAHSIGTYMCIYALSQLKGGHGSSSIHFLESASRMNGSCRHELIKHPEMADNVDCISEESRHMNWTNTLKRKSCAGQDNDRIVKLIGLFPFLTVDPQCSTQTHIRLLASWYIAAGWIAAMISALPNQILRWMLQRVSPGLEEHAAKTALQLVNPKIVRNSLFLAKGEFEALAAPPDWRLLSELGTRFAVLCCPNDHWMPRWIFEQMLQDVPGVEAYWEEGQCHAFCISTAKSHQVADKVIKILGDSAVIP